MRETTHQKKKYVTKVFGNKVQVVKETKKTKKFVYETQIEKKKYVFWILKNVMPFLNGQAQIKVEVETTK